MGSGILPGGAAVPSSSLSDGLRQQHHPAADFPKLRQDSESIDAFLGVASCARAHFYIGAISGKIWDDMHGACPSLCPSGRMEKCEMSNGNPSRWFPRFCIEIIRDT